jgi:hypothetical protein
MTLHRLLSEFFKIMSNYLGFFSSAISLLSLLGGRYEIFVMFTTVYNKTTVSSR